ncbi:MAG TPA: isoamylase early set domain-containing protein [Gemmatimonadales bacterium]|nr:isoamylase early set domain-containing protein [Gemmatimonadales bacterium]
MFERQDEEDIVERVVRELRQPVSIDAALDARVMNEIARPTVAEPNPVARRSITRLWPWLAAAAVLGAILIARPWSHKTIASDAFQFVLVAPQAASVSLVGDFNDWDPARTPMHAAHGGVWATVVPLAPGRYRYAFLVNGVEWRADPGAPAARDDEFGAPSSVVTVGGRGT